METVDMISLIRGTANKTRKTYAKGKNPVTSLIFRTLRNAAQSQLCCISPGIHAEPFPLTQHNLDVLGWITMQHNC
ncbi:hypothetical protein J6TS7_55570 [Paenibacillus dendritiformis]|nr:hypothetical protein PAV_16p00060 [Paenibacillus alvei DSM 29]GIO81947.1 hypothetical protein J6TS7_55570 [Paenibacillus dendritiformis]